MVRAKNGSLLLSLLFAAPPLLGACGVEGETEAEHNTQEIRGGTTAGPGVFSEVVQVGGFCSGTLIADRWVLTAAHCFTDCPTASNPPNLQPTTVTFTQVTPAAGGALFNATIATKAPVIHPNFCNGAWFSNDYALLELTTPVSSVVSGVTPMAIASGPGAVGTNHYLVGYAGDSPGCNPNVYGTRRWAFTALDVITNRGTPNSPALRFDDPSKHACPGDSGGPALRITNSRFVVSGVASWGNLASDSQYAAADAAIESWMGVKVFDGTSFGGAAQSFFMGTYDHRAMFEVGNDRISSMKIAPGFKVRLWSESGSWGDSQVYEGSVANVGTLLNDRASHIDVLPGVTLYRESEFWGVQQTFTEGHHNVQALDVVGNDQVSSIIVAPGMSATLCSESSWWGDCQTFTGKVSHVGALLNDRTSSLTVSKL